MHQAFLAPVTLSFIVNQASTAPTTAPLLWAVTKDWGTSVTDNYRWMEASPKPTLAAYEKSQINYQRAKLHAIQGQAALPKDIATDSNLTSSTDSLMITGSSYFFCKRAPARILRRSTQDIRRAGGQLC